MPDPASGMEMDPEFVRLVRNLRQEILDLERADPIVRRYYSVDEDITALWRYVEERVGAAVDVAFQVGYNKGRDDA